MRGSLCPLLVMLIQIRLCSVGHFVRLLKCFDLLFNLSNRKNKMLTKINIDAFGKLFQKISLMLDNLLLYANWPIRSCSACKFC